MGNIRDLLNKIRYATYGKEVRQSIHDAIEECYATASVDHDNANMEVKIARGTHNTLNDRLVENEKKQENLSSQLDTITNNTVNIKSFMRDSNNLDEAIFEMSKIVTENSTVIIPNGNYTVSDVSILFSINNINIKGESLNGVIITFLNKNNFETLNKQNINVSNIIFKNAYRIQFKNSSFIKFENCVFNNFYNAGVVYFNSHDITFCNCKFDSIGFELTESIGAGGYAIGIDGNSNFGKCYNISIKKCYFTNTCGRGAIFLITDVTNWIIEHNEFFQTGYSAIAMSIQKSTDGIIRNNYINRCGFGLRSNKIIVKPSEAGVGASSIYGGNPNNTTIVENNTIINSMENAIEGEFYIVKGNIINGTGIDIINYPTPSTEGIYGAKNIINNIISNTKGSGIKYFGSKGVHNTNIVGNIFNSCGGCVEINCQSPTSEFTCSNVTIKDNSFSSSLKECINLLSNSFKPCKNFIITNNSFINCEKKYNIEFANVKILSNEIIVGENKNKNLLEQTEGICDYYKASKNAYNTARKDENQDTYMRITGDTNPYSTYIYQDINIPKGIKDIVVNCSIIAKINVLNSYALQVTAIMGNIEKYTTIKTLSANKYLYEFSFPISSTSDVSTLRLKLANVGENTSNHIDLYNIDVRLVKQ